MKHIYMTFISDVQQYIIIYDIFYIYHWDGSIIYGEQSFKEMTYNFSGIKTGDIINFYGYCTGNRYWETITNFTLTCNLTFS